jgi:hypothetical protein
MGENIAQAMLQIDREDLLAVIAMRFGNVPAAVHMRIASCQDRAALERWILVAANASSWEVLLEELAAGSAAFRLVGPKYQPIVAHGPSATVPYQHLSGED